MLTMKIKEWCVALLLCSLPDITVSQNLVIVDVPTYVEVEEARKLDVRCNVTNRGDYPNAVFTYKWTKQSSQDWEQQGSNLVITEVVTEDADIYTCEVTMVNPAGIGLDSMQLVILYFARWIWHQIPKFAGHVGDDVTLECHVNAVPAVSFYWQFAGQNISVSGGGTRVGDEENISKLALNNIQESHFGEYTCHAVNSQGDMGFKIQLLKPGLPDSPQQCNVGNVTAHNATLHCLPGYSGGEPLGFTVYKESPHHEREQAESTHIVQGNMAEILVKRLDPNINWTLVVFQSNVHGSSHEGVGVLIRTKDGPPLTKDQEFPVVLVAIIAGVCGGVILVIVLITVVACVIIRKSPKKEDTRPALGSVGSVASVGNKKNTGSYVMEEEDNMANVSREDSQRFNRKNSWGSFKRKKPLKPLSGMANPNYDGSSGSLNQPRPARYDSRASPYTGGNFGPSFINLSPAPGESSDYDNHGYMRDSHISPVGSQETSFYNTGPGSPNGPGVDPQVMLRRQLANPMDRASRLSKGQPSLAGMGALSFYPDPTRAAIPPPISPSVTPTRTPTHLFPGMGADDKISVHIKPPSFIPEVPWEFPRQKLYIRTKLGIGSFGEVWRAQAEGILGRPGSHVVAVKMLKEHYNPEDKRALHKELALLKLLQPHPNVIQLLGCCSTSDPVCVIMEYAENGSLQDLLRRQRSAFEMNDLSSDNPDTRTKRNINFKLRDFTIFGLHIASGMEYISSQQLLHRDLATRKILVDEHMICKVGDFASARDITETRQYDSKSQVGLPVRWMAPESLFQSLYSVDSDVWSFGVALWEIYTIGSTPYPNMSSRDVTQFIQKGCRMAKPKHCSEAMYAIMKDCWNQFPPKRPSFSILRHRLTAILDDPNSDIYVDQLEDNVYAIMSNQPGEKC